MAFKDDTLGLIDMGERPVVYEKVADVLLADGKWHIPAGGKIRMAYQWPDGSWHYRFEDSEYPGVFYDGPSQALLSIRHRI